MATDKQHDGLIEAARRLAAEAARHPACASAVTVRAVGALRFTLAFAMRVQRASRATDADARGVRATEPVELVFHGGPMRAPVVRLRADFPRDLAHINPSQAPDRVYPCVSDVPLREVYAREGVSGVLNALSEWLRNAAIGALVSEQQGWEPARRDELRGKLTFDIERLRRLVTAVAGTALLPVDAVVIVPRPQEPSALGVVTAYAPVALAAERLELPSKRPEEATCARTLCVIAWGDETAIDGTYRPDAVHDWTTLLEAAERAGCRNGVEHAVRDAYRLYRRGGGLAGFVCFVVLCARRPIALRGQAEDPAGTIEVLPYVVHARPVQARTREEGLQPEMAGSSPVAPIAHYAELSIDLLRRLSGTPVQSPRRRTAVIGCGSLGSKIALHLGKAGIGDFDLYDDDDMLPHNAARHGLIPRPDHPALPKARLLAQELRKLRLDAEPFQIDVVEVISESGALELRDGTDLIVDTTASSAVHECLTAAAVRPGGARLATAALAAQARIGLLGLEGQGRLPNIADLYAAFWWRVARDPLLAKHVQEAAAPARQILGQGCGSFTAVIPDGRLSLFAAGMAERLRLSCAEPPSAQGQLYIGHLDELGMGVTWTAMSVAPMLVVQAENDPLWTVRVSAEVAAEFAAAAAAAGGIETGGHLVGHVSTIRNCVTVVGRLEPPAGSNGGPTQFLLGANGVLAEAARIGDATAGHLAIVGTWHSHPKGGGPSGTDIKALAQMVAERDDHPTACLIWTPNRLRALVGSGSQHLAPDRVQVAP